MNFSVIIPSRSAANLVPCVQALRSCEPVAQIIVIDDGIDWSAAWHLKSQLTVIQGAKPFVFARNVNLGIQACDGDVILLNDDALLETPFGFHELEQASHLHPEFGVISAVTNLAGNPAQRPQDVGLRIERRSVAFVCVYIPRGVINDVGLLDERFTAYGWEDNDYCRRVREAGLEVGIFDDCFVDHSSLHSTFRGLPHAPGDISLGREIYRAKWGDTA